MAARIFLCVLVLVMLAVFHLSAINVQDHCRYSRGCYICKNRRSNMDNCPFHRYCLHPGNRFQDPECIKYPQEKKQICGIRPKTDIVGGSQANEGDWPWQVSLQTKYFVHICGGVLIERQWILTAAHCVYRANARDLIVVLGEFDLKRKSGREQLRRIKNIFVHPQFKSSYNYPNDVALIQLEHYANYNEYVFPVCLPSLNDHYPTNSCSITGWGKTRGTGDNSRLRVLHVKMLSPLVCKGLWSASVQPRLHICVNDGLKGACSGDSGGPLSCIRRSDGRFVVAGVTSWGDRSCSRLGYPSIYTNIRTFVSWIKKIINFYQ